jgi:hypothetical protein
MANILNAFELELREGESWDDPMTLNMTREQANVLLASLTMQMQAVTEGIAEAKRSADRGDLTSMLAQAALSVSALELQSLLHIVAKVVDPVRYAEVMDSDEVGYGA